MRLLENLRMWYLDHFVPYITIQQSNEHFFVSRQLWKIIDADLTSEQKQEIKVFFKYIKDEKRYLMIINPDMHFEFEDGVISDEAFAKQEEIAKRKKELSEKPRSVQIIEEVRRINQVVKNGDYKQAKAPDFPQTFPLQLNIFGRIGFQGTQPSPAMIIYTYDLDNQVADRYHRFIEFSDRVSLRVIPVIYRPEVYGQRHAYYIEPDVVCKPKRTK